MKNKMDNYDEGDEVEVSSIPLPSFSSPPPPHDDEEGHKPDDVYFSPDTFDWGWGEDDKDLVPSNQRGALCPGKFEQPPTIRRKCPPPSSFYYAYPPPLPPPALHETHLDSIACNTTAESIEGVSFSNLKSGPLLPSFFYDQRQPLQLDKKKQNQTHGGPQPQLFDCQLKVQEDLPHMNVLDPNNQPPSRLISPRTAESEISTNIPRARVAHPTPTRLSLPYDENFLEPVHNLLRSSCIDVFVCRNGDNSGAGGRRRGVKPTHVEGQVGLRCADCKHIPKCDRANQSVSYPSKMTNIFESVRNYQRFHFEACEYIPSSIKVKYSELMLQASTKKTHRKNIKTYFVVAAYEIGIVQSPYGLFFGVPPNTSGKPSEKLQAIMSTDDSSASNRRQLQDLLFPKVDDLVENSKFSHIASATTRQVIASCRQEKTAFVYPSDYPTLSDFRFVLYHQFAPCRPSASKLERRKTVPKNCDNLSGLWCKHCAKAYLGEQNHNRGMYFPLDFESLRDTSFFNNLTCHIITCRFVPPETKEALDELQRLAAEQGVVTKRGTKALFLKKLWGRMANYYAAP